MLRALDAATRPEHVRRWSIRVSGNRRVIFGLGGIDAIDVDLEDYH
jgi:plasmid maintenance system killer protein